MDTEKYKSLENMALELGCNEAKIIPTTKVTVENRVQFKCISCPYYGKKLKCPPYAPAPNEFREVLKEYNVALIVNLKPPEMSENFKNEFKMRFGSNQKEISLNEFHDIDKSNKIMKEFTESYRAMLKILLELERSAFNQGYILATLFFAGHCRICEKCNTETEECRHPTSSRFSAEAMGINIIKTANNAGMEIEFPIGENLEKIKTFAVILIE